MARKITKFSPELAARNPNASDGLALASAGPHITKAEKQAFNGKVKQRAEAAERAKALGISISRLDAIEYAAEIASKLRAGDRHYMLNVLRKAYDAKVDAEREWCEQWTDAESIADQDLCTPKFSELLAKPSGKRRDGLIARLDSHAALVLGNRSGYIACVPQGRYDPDIWVNVALLFCTVEQIARDEEGPLMMPAVEHAWLYKNAAKPTDARMLWWTRASEKRDQARSKMAHAQAQAEFARYAPVAAPAVEQSNDVIAVQAQEIEELDAMSQTLDDMLIGLVKPEPEAEPAPEAQPEATPDIADHALNVLQRLESEGSEPAPQADINHAASVLASLQAGQTDEMQEDSTEVIDIEPDTPESINIDETTTSVNTDQLEQIDSESMPVQISDDDALLALFIDPESTPANQSQSI